MYKWRSAWLQYVAEQRLLWLVPRSFDVLALLTPVFYREQQPPCAGGLLLSTGPCIQPPVIPTTGVPLHTYYGGYSLSDSWSSYAHLLENYSWKCNGGSFLEPPCSYAHVSTYSDSMLTQNNFIAVKFDSVFRFNLYHLHQILKRKLCGVLPN